MSERPTRVVHQGREPFDVFIGRPSIWGNPFASSRERNRPTVIAQYAAWVIQQPHLMARVGLLRGQVMGCYCAPRACHGDVLALLADGVPAGCVDLFIPAAARSP